MYDVGQKFDITSCPEERANLPERITGFKLLWKTLSFWMPFWQWYNAIFPKLLEFASKMLLSMHFYVIYCIESFIAKKIF